MTNFLPRFLSSKKDKYKLATIVDCILILAILIYGRQPTQQLMSPVVSSIHNIYTKTSTHLPRETFAFVPDLASDKFPSIDLQGLTNLSFFDVPLTTDGSLNYYSRGYQSFTSDETIELFNRAHQQNTKVFLTLSALDPQIITDILNNPYAQQKLADGAIYEIKNSNLDGITIDFEGPQLIPQDKFANLIKYLTNKIHEETPNAKVAIAVPSSQINNYNLLDLANTSDKIFIIAADFIVPEEKNATLHNPAFGYQENEYWNNVASILNKLPNKIPANKLVMERAWYGNGDNYPLYIPTNQSSTETSSIPIQLDQDTMERLVQGVPTNAQAAARKSIPLIAKALNQEGILDSNVLAYALATIEHETDGTFEPISEIGGNINARRLGYEGGSNYFGRGFIQITHLRNYLKIGQRIGLGDKLVKNPELASVPEIAAKILAAFFKDNNVANLASQGYFVAARRPINPDYNGYLVANLTWKYWLY